VETLTCLGANGNASIGRFWAASGMNLMGAALGDVTMKPAQTLFAGRGRFAVADESRRSRRWVRAEEAVYRAERREVKNLDVDTFSGKHTAPLDRRGDKGPFLSYAMSVIVFARPWAGRVRFKPVHRRVLYSENDWPAAEPSGNCKSATVVGEVIGGVPPARRDSVRRLR